MKKMTVVMVWIALCLAMTWGAGAAAAPRVEEVVPPMGARDVPVDIGEVVIIFDRAMKTGGWSLVRHGQYPVPPLRKNTDFWEDEYTFVLPLETLKPGTTYAFQLNSASKKGFAAAEDGAPLPATVIMFTTAGSGRPQAAPGRTDAPRPGATDRKAEGSPPGAGRAGLPGTVVFRMVAEPRERAFSILVPKGWTTEGGIFRLSAAKAGGPGNAVAAKNDFTLKKDRAGTVMLHYLPDWNYADGQGLTQLFPTGSNYQGMRVWPMPGASAFLTHMFRQIRPNAANVRTLDQRRLPQTVQAYQKALAGFNQSLRQIGLAPAGIDAAQLVVEYTENGVRFREELATAIVDLRHAARQWNNSRTYAFRAPAGEFEAWRRLLAISHASIKINPKWLAGELRGQDQRARQVVKTMHEIQRIEAEMSANRRKTQESIMHENYLALTGQEDFVNPYTGEVERDTSDYRYRWVSPGGDRVYSNQEDFNPNLVDNRTDFKRSPVRPRQ